MLYSQLKDLTQVEVNSKWSITSQNDKKVVTLTNKSDKIAFFIEMRVTDKNGQTVLPVMWSDNYVTLLPNDSRTYEAFFKVDKVNDNLSVKLKGFNVNK